MAGAIGAIELIFLLIAVVAPPSLPSPPSRAVLVLEVPSSSQLLQAGAATELRPRIQLSAGAAIELS